MTVTFLIDDLTKKKCEQNLKSLIEISEDVSHWRENEFFFQLPQKWRYSFFVRSDEPIAYCVMSRKWADRNHIHQFMVRQDWRGKGIGAVMIAEAKRRSSDLLLSLKVGINNSGAIRFYERSGLIIEKQEGDYYWMIFKPSL